MYSLTGMKRCASKYSMSVSMYRAGARGSGRPRTAPPDLRSILLDAWIVYLGMPIVPPDTELFIWDASKSCSKQIIIILTYLRERKLVFLSLIYLYFISNVFNINMYLKIIY
ncbi:unnamed protein product [Musa hybrid cultivar]